MAVWIQVVEGKATTESVAVFRDTSRLSAFVFQNLKRAVVYVYLQ